MRQAFLLLFPGLLGVLLGPPFRAYLDGLNMIFLNAVFRAPAHASPVR